MSIALRCRCGKVRGEIDPAGVYARATCYCKDCQAFARWLGAREAVDTKGGTDVVAMAPASIRFTAGQDRIACMSLGPRGLLRWYASCCRTPLANTPRDPKLHYAGVVTACFDVALDAVDAELGPRDRIVLNAGSASAPVKATPLAFLLGGLRIFAGIAGARLRGRRASPFFDAASAPVSAPEVLDLQTRRSLG